MQLREPTLKIRIIFVFFLIIIVGIGSLHVFSNRSFAANVNNPAKTSPPGIKFPALVDVGAKQCIPCKMMAPILEELKAEYAGRLRVEFIDVQIDPDTATKLGVRGIPTQIFYDASGKELYRHMGYISKEDILAAFKKLGINIDKKISGKKSR